MLWEERHLYCAFCFSQFRVIMGFYFQEEKDQPYSYRQALSELAGLKRVVRIHGWHLGRDRTPVTLESNWTPLNKPPHEQCIKWLPLPLWIVVGLLLFCSLIYGLCFTSLVLSPQLQIYVSFPWWLLMVPRGILIPWITEGLPMPISNPHIHHPE